MKKSLILIILLVILIGIGLFYNKPLSPKTNVAKEKSVTTETYLKDDNLGFKEDYLLELFNKRTEVGKALESLGFERITTFEEFKKPTASPWGNKICYKGTKSFTVGAEALTSEKYFDSDESSCLWLGYPATGEGEQKFAYCANRSLANKYFAGCSKRTIKGKAEVTLTNVCEGGGEFALSAKVEDFKFVEVPECSDN